jgi:hypothetical protein
MPQQILCHLGGPSVASLAPALHVFPQPVHQRQVVTLLLREEGFLLRAGALDLEVVGGGPAALLLERLVLTIDPVFPRFLVRTVQDRIGDRLRRTPLGGRD